MGKLIIQGRVLPIVTTRIKELMRVVYINDFGGCRKYANMLLEINSRLFYSIMSTYGHKFDQAVKTADRHANLLRHIDLFFYD